MALSDYTSYPFPQDTSGTTNTISSNTSFDTMTGSSDNDYFQVTSGNVPTIYGYGGDDFIEITSSDQDDLPDIIIAGDGNDTILITGGVDTDTSGSSIQGGAGQDYIGVDYATNGVGAASDNIGGGTEDDVIEVFNANGSSDLNILAGDGNDIIVVEDSNNVLIGGGSTIRDDATDGNDTFNITNVTGITEIDGSAGDDIFNITNSEANASGHLTGGWGDDTFNLDGTGGTLDVQVFTGDPHQAEDVNTVNITTDDASDFVLIDDFQDGGTNDVYDAAEDDVITVTEGGSTMSNADFWNMLATGTLAGPIASVTNVSSSRIEMTTTNGATIQVDNVQVACFMNGTSIATPAGEVAVETLAIGDEVTTADGNTAPVKWMGRREVSSVFAAKNASVQPILITQGALGNGLPTADLRVSPDHAMYVDGVLIHAEALVNGTSIVREAIAETFTYYHIELENHDLVLANGAAAETFVDSDVRARFDNAAEYAELYGTTESAASQATHMALPRVKSKRQLPAAIKAKLDQAKTA